MARKSDSQLRNDENIQSFRVRIIPNNNNMKIPLLSLQNSVEEKEKKKKVQKMTTFCNSAVEV